MAHKQGARGPGGAGRKPRAHAQAEKRGNTNALAPVLGMQVTSQAA